MGSDMANNLAIFPRKDFCSCDEKREKIPITIVILGRPWREVR